MKAAFVGKGGSGKTTLSALFCRYLATRDADRVLAFDADINQHLAVALGADPGESERRPALGDHLEEIKEYLRGDNPRIASAAAMLKTTPPGPGSRLVRVGEANPLWDRLVTTAGGVRLAVTGPFAADDLGVACYHSKVGAVELLLNHMPGGPGEYAVVDMTAGADSFASGLFTRFDLTFLVCEPTVRSVAVYRQYIDYALDYGVRLAVVGNKVEDAEDVAFLREQVGADLLCWFGRSAFVRAAERGRFLPIDELEPANARALAELRTALDGCEPDWARYAEQAAEFHTRNALAWGNARAGADLTTQIEPGYTMAPATAAR
ncbi:ATP-binding protein [Dactylosporangium sp. CA-139066]|uniref:ATP-binding protein n=1 Tax=Dactylosporangium sp. CA-139066 TaxID=3239930 RepID=UPI003D905B6E